MGDRRSWRPGAVAIGLVAALCLAAGPAAAQDDPGEEQDEQVPVDLGAYGTPMVFTAPEGTVFEVDDRRYTGTIEVRVAPDGELTVINTVPMETYVEGIAEMPARWPLEALKAQAVAARTYAWFELRQGRWARFGFDICATTACQVYAGRSVVEAPEVGERWEQAVAETAGQVLVHDGAPILARYFSTSGGATRNNEHVFPAEGPRPYLKGVEDPDDAVSPLHRWTATFTREQMDAILARGERLSEAVPVASIEHRTAEGRGSDRVRITGSGGAVVEVGASEFRGFVSSVAEELYPDVFPQDRPDGQPLPTTLPSSRFDVEVTEEAVTIHGRGWGHGVGLGQFGAMGKAERGLDHREILASYYNGLEPVRADGVPDRIRVGLTTDAEEITIAAGGPFTLRSGGATITERGLGRWRLVAAPQATMRLLAPTGYGAPLVVAPTEVSRRAPFVVEVVTLDTVVNKPAELSLEVTDRDTGEVVRTQPLGIVEAGRHRTAWDLDDDGGGQVPAGAYDARLVAVDEESTSAGEAAIVEVRAPAAPEGAIPSLLGTVPDPADVPDAPWILAATLLGLAAGAMAGRLVPVRR